MKKGFKTLMIGLMAAGMLTACSEESRLAKQVTGSWASSPERIADPSAISASMVRILDFVKDSDSAGGQLVMSGLITVNSTVNATSPTINTPISYSASGVATVQGEWAAHDDDEIILMLDPATFNLQVDPQAVVLDYNLIDGNSQATTDSLKPALMTELRAQMRRMVETQFFNAGKIDDIKVKDGMMSCEIDDRDVTFRRQEGEAK